MTPFMIMTTQFMECFWELNGEVRELRGRLPRRGVCDGVIKRISPEDLIC